MPRLARIDIPGLLQHVIVRGIERRPIVADDEDRDCFTGRLEHFLRETNTDCYAWALLDNHFHLLVCPRTGRLSLFMRRFLTSYAVTFNNRHQRHGHLFQNRYKSVVCDANNYLQELIRYIHLNPLRAGIVSSITELDRHPWCGHRQLVRTEGRSLIDEDLVLPLFSQQRKESRHHYRQFISDGLNDTEVGLSAGGKRASLAFDDSLDKSASFDERILGGGHFVECILEQINETPMAERPPIADIVGLVAEHFELPPDRLSQPGKAPLVAQAKAVICFFTVRRLAYLGGKVGKALCLTPGAVSHASRRGEDILFKDPVLNKKLDRYL